MTQRNADSREAWGPAGNPDIEDVWRSCMGYASTPAWPVIARTISEHFHSPMNIESIELGAGLGKMSVLLSLLGIHATLVDYSDKQIRASRVVHDFFSLKTDIVKADILNLPCEMEGKFDIAISSGTAEHFFEEEREKFFVSHARVLKKNGVALIWVPNKYGLLFHCGRTVRRMLGKKVSVVDELSFRREDLRARAESAGLAEIRIYGATTLGEDFNNFIINIPRILRSSRLPTFKGNAENAKEDIISRMRKNTSRISFWNNRFSYALMLIGTRI